MPHGAYGFYFAYIVATSSLSALDIVSMGLLSLVLAPTLSGSPVVLPLFGEFPPESAVWFILIACALIVVKGVIAVFLHWRATRRFARYELEVGDRLLAGYTELAWTERSAKTTSDITRVADSGIANTIMGFLLPLSGIPANILTFAAVSLVLVVSEPIGAIVVTVYLGIIAYLLFAVISRKALVAGRVNREYAYRAAAVITELVEALKEVTLRGRLGEVRDMVRGLRSHATRARANISFLAIVPKYVIEAALIGGLLLIGGVSYLTGGLDSAVAAVALFAVTGFRLIPAITGVQGALTQAAANVVHAENVIDDIGSAAHAVHEKEPADTAVLPESPSKLVLDDVHFAYPGAERPALDGVSLEIPFGSTFGVAGPSGAGKSTLIDILLGLAAPSSGSVRIDGVDVSAATRAWRSSVAYVPQHVALFAGSVAQNVALTWGDDIDDERVDAALERAQLAEFIAQRGGIHTAVGERGLDLSGGQRQRLGIARALYAAPRVLVLDEATSALDGRTEESVAKAIRGLRGEVTVISVAHRLSTIRTFDRIAYLADGRVVDTGAFDELQRRVPEFRQQARLAGLEVNDA
ncbi:ABC transporter ATP-binding protein [Agromyces sp. NPDC057679]|uniref:ABC transporter ATP-binding protein n=1 Tax=Agromyces sp. NPDC057679 TaxID=3346207 RepID=UPI00366F3471